METFRRWTTTVRIGNVACRNWYHPHGEMIGSSTCTSDDTDYFTSKERDPETGLDYFGARYHASTLGRFTSVDPAMESYDPSAPKSLNRYSYVANNPLILVDPDGRYAVLFNLLTRIANHPTSQRFWQHAERSATRAFNAAT